MRISDWSSDVCSSDLSDWRKAADALGKARAKAGKVLSKATTTLIAELGMGGGRFDIALAPVGARRPDPQGAERAQFLVSTNSPPTTRPRTTVESGCAPSLLSLTNEVTAEDRALVQTCVLS